MTSRRKFIQSGLAISALSVAELSPLQAAVATNEHASLILQDFVFDNRFRFASDIARQVAAQGIYLAEMSGDLTRLWAGRYLPLWKQGPMTLAGVTAEDGLFVLGTLAADHGMRVIHNAELAIPSQYREDPDETLYNWIIAPKKT